MIPKIMPTKLSIPLGVNPMLKIETIVGSAMNARTIKMSPEMNRMVGKNLTNLILLNSLFLFFRFNIDLGMLYIKKYSATAIVMDRCEWWPSIVPTNKDTPTDATTRTAIEIFFNMGLCSFATLFFNLKWSKDDKRSPVSINHILSISRLKRSLLISISGA